jgi:hypothetical protein
MCREIGHPVVPRSNLKNATPPSSGLYQKLETQEWAFSRFMPFALGQFREKLLFETRDRNGSSTWLALN